MVAQPDQPVDIGFDGALGIMAKREGVDGALPQGCCAHGEPPVQSGIPHEYRYERESYPK